MEYIYFDTTHAIEVHDKIIQNSGGSMGLLNIGLLESTLEHVQNDWYYPSFEDKVSHLFYAINKNHCFNDGNKRASIVLSAYFLEINGFSKKVDEFILKMEDNAVHVADNRIDKALLQEIITSIIYEDDYSEELKLKIYYALS